MPNPKPHAHFLSPDPYKVGKEPTYRRSNAVAYLVNNYLDHAAFSAVALQIKGMLERDIPVSYELIDFLIEQENTEAIASFVTKIRQRRDEQYRQQRDGFVYFIENQNQIKIGYSVDPGARAVSLSLRENNVVAVIEAEKTFEKLLHEKFAAYRIGTTEWFEDCQAIRTFIEDYAEPFTYKHRSRRERERVTIPREQAYQNLLNAIAGRS
jgi:hypothetical protein